MPFEPTSTLAMAFPPGVGWHDAPVQSLPGGADIFGSAFRRRIVPQGHSGQGYRDYSCITEDIVALRSCFSLFQDASNVIASSDLLKFHFCLDGANAIRFEGETDIMVRSGTAVLAMHPDGMTKRDSHHADVVENSLTFVCRPRAVIELLQLEADSLRDGLRQSLSGGSIDFFCRDVPLSGRMIQTITDMFSQRYSPAIRHIHAQARMLDLMCLLLDALITNHDEPRSGVILRARDKEDYD